MLITLKNSVPTAGLRICSSHSLLSSKYLSTFSAFDFPRSAFSSIEEAGLATKAAAIEEWATEVTIEE